MTVYFIYKHGKNIDTPYLYAITDNKRIKDKFFRERKKSMFKSIEKDMDKNLYKKFLSEHKSYELWRRGFETSSPDGLGKKAHIFLIATAYEEMNVVTQNDRVIMEIGKYTDEIARTFNKDLLKALNKLYYFEIYKFCNSDFYGCNDYFVRGVIPFKSEDFCIDSFSVFLFLYGDTLDKKVIINSI